MITTEPPPLPAPEKPKGAAYRLRFTRYGWNIYRGRVKIMGPIEEEWRARRVMEDLAERPEISPCPFCGTSEPRVVGYPAGFFMECPCGVDMGPEPSREYLIAKWNRRPGNIKFIS